MSNNTYNIDQQRIASLFSGVAISMTDTVYSTCTMCTYTCIGAGAGSGYLKSRNRHGPKQARLWILDY